MARHGSLVAALDVHIAICCDTLAAEDLPGSGPAVREDSNVHKRDRCQTGI